VLGVFLCKSEAGNLAPIAAVSFLCRADYEAQQQKDLAESGTQSL